MSEEAIDTSSEEVEVVSESVQESPDWFMSDKYSSVEEQAKGYSELSKKFGGFTGAPKDGYAVPEGIDAEDDMLKTFMDYATESNMNQDNFNKGFELLTAQSEVTSEVSVESEIEKLGDNAKARIDRADQFLINNLSNDKYNEIKDFVTTADAIKLVEMLIPASAAGNLPNGDNVGTTKITRAEVDALSNALDDNGNPKRQDKEYDKMVMAKFAELHS